MKLKFEEFLERGIVKRQAPNKQRALSLIKEAESNELFLKTALQIIPSEKMHPNFIVNSCYDIIMELLRSKMFADGYNAGNSHEAEVSYLKNLGFSEAEVIFMDELRYYRNGTKYYGIILDKEYANSVLGFMNSIINKLKEKLKNVK